MPSIVIAVASAATYAATIEAGFLAASFAATLVSYGLTEAFGLNKRPSAPNFADEARGRTQMVRSSTEPRKIVYGTSVVSGPLVYANTTGDKNEYLHLVIPLAGHEVEEIGEVYFNDKPTSEYDQFKKKKVVEVDFRLTGNDAYYYSYGDIYKFSLEVDSVVYTGSTLQALVSSLQTAGYSATLLKISGYNRGIKIKGSDYHQDFTVEDARLYIHHVYNGYDSGEIKTIQSGNSVYRINKHLGSTTQTADSDLVSEVSDWTTDHRLQGVAYIYVRLKYDDEIFINGIPNIKAVVKGKKVYDPRTSTTAWSDNWALCVRDYITNELGMGASSSEIDDTTFIAAANLSDETVTATTTALSITSSAAATGFYTGKTVVNCGRSFPSGTTVTISGHSDAALNGAHTVYAPYVGRVQSEIGFILDLSGIEGTGGSFTVEQERYTCNGVVDSSNRPADVLQQLTTAAAGAVTYIQGKYKIKGGAYTAPVSLTLDESNLRGPVTVRPRVPRKELYNGVRGTFLSPDNSWQASDFPSMTNATYVTQDGGETIYRDIELPYTIDPFAAQRIAKIHLERSRQGITVDLPCNLSVLELAPFDNVQLSLERFGWTNKEFRIVDWSFNTDGGIDLELKEEASASYNWLGTDATVVDPAPDTNLPSAFDVDSPTGLTLNTYFESASDSTGVGTRKTYVLNWETTTEFGYRYEIEYRPSGAAFYGDLGTSKTNRFQLPDLPANSYDFRVRALSALGHPSAWNELVQAKVAGYTPPPPNVSGLELDGLGSQDGKGNSTVFEGRDAKFRWRKSAATRSFEFDEAPSGGDSGEHSRFITGYQVKVFKNNVLVRTEFTRDNWYTYTYEKNAEDGLSREFTVKVAALNANEEPSPVEATMSVSNPAPSLPTGVSITAGFQTITISYTAPSDLDWDGVKVWLGTSTGFVRDENSLVYDGPNTKIDLTGLVTGTTYYLRFAAYDAFGKTGLTESSEYSITTDVAITSEEIDSLIADKIAAGELGDAVSLGGVFVASGTEAVLNGTGPSAGNWRLDLGPVSDGGTTYVQRYHDGSGNSNYSLDESGNVAVAGSVTITSGSGIANLSDTTDTIINHVSVDVPNASFEAGDTQWDKNAGWTIEENAESRSGGWVARHNGGTNSGLVSDHHTPVQEGDRIAVEVWGKGDSSADGLFRAGVEWYDDDLTYLSYSSGSYVSIDTSWKKARSVAQAPADAAFAKVYFATGSKSAGNLYVDDVVGTRYPRDADDIPESTTKKWAAESGADVTGNNTSADTSSVNGTAASTVATATANFNSRNDRDGSSIAAPTIATDGTAVDHVVNDDGSADVSFEWSWGGVESDIDGFQVYVRASTSGTAYNFGTTPAEETVYTIQADRRAFILTGTPVNKHYTWGVRAFRVVDADVDASGLITTSIVQPSLAAEDPYQPSTSVAFAGSITGTIGGASDAGALATADDADWSTQVTGTGKPSNNASADVTFVATGNCQFQGNTLYKNSGSNAWDSQVYSKESWVGSAYVSFSPDQTDKNEMVGLNTDPTTDAIYASIDYAWYCITGGGVKIFESGLDRGSFGNYTTDTILSIAYDGQNIKYYIDGVLARTVAVSSGLKFYLDSSFYHVGAQVSSVTFGPHGRLPDDADEVPESATKKWAGETGADVTGSNSLVMLHNPSFEAGDKGWTKQSGWEIVPSTDSRSGSYVARRAGDGTTKSIKNNYLLPVNEGDRIFLQAWGLGSTTNGEFRVYITWRDDDLVNLGNSFGDITNITTSYVAANVLGTAPAGAAYAELYVQDWLTHTTGNLYIDDVSVAYMPRDADDIPESSTKKWAGESGADKTSTAITDNVILSSGALTFQTSSVDTLKIDGSNKRIWINDATYGNQGIQLEYNGGTPRFHMGDRLGGGPFIEYDGTDLIAETLKTSTGSGKRIELNPSGDNELHFYGDRGDGVIAELATIGLTASPDVVIGDFYSMSGNRIGVRGYSGDFIGVRGDSINDVGIYGVSSNDYGIVATSINYIGLLARTDQTSSFAAVFEGDPVGSYGIKSHGHEVGVYAHSLYNYGIRADGPVSPLILVPDGSSSAPTHSATAGALWVTSAGILYICTGDSTWQKVGAQ